ncbi:hypothetical protein EYF80_044337 [Liparis tanakae]|uniref:Uncharacterized protein n=1 Tax=Liparis tanakae TaxID=230148 RepID=A0A4Z2FW38_9TELE|nr:hypothetical protein EYF80_044337 [Liparis tanakae]
MWPTWIGHPVLDGLGDGHRDPGSLLPGLNGAGVDVPLGGDALLIGLQQLFNNNNNNNNTLTQSIISTVPSPLYLRDLHSLLRGPGLRVGSSEDPELGLDQGAVGQVHAAHVEVDHASSSLLSRSHADSARRARSFSSSRVLLYSSMTSGGTEPGGGAASLPGGLRMRSLLRICPRTASMRRDFCSSRLMEWHVLKPSTSRTPENRSSSSASRGSHMVREGGGERCSLWEFVTKATIKREVRESCGASA